MTADPLDEQADEVGAGTAGEGWDVPGLGRSVLGGGSSVWPVAQQDLGGQRRGRYVRASGAHPGRMAPALAAYAIATYTDPGDLVLDPMCGIGTTLVEAVHAGRDGIGIDYEHRWAQLARDNLTLAARQAATGDAAVARADARDLAAHVPVDMVGRVRLVLTSPPYGDSTHGRVKVPTRPGLPVVSHMLDSYGHPGDQANLAHAPLDVLAEGLTRILTGCVRLLRPDASVVITARPWRRSGELIDLPSLVIEAAEHAGLVHTDRCVALLAGRHAGRLVSRPSFHQLLQLRRARTQGHRVQLIAHEDVLIFAPP